MKAVKVVKRAVIRRVLASLLLVALFGVLILMGSGCSKNHHITIQSNSCWIAIIDRQIESQVSACGSTNYRVAGDLDCVIITNLTDTGFVRIRIDDGLWAESSAPRGTAESCR